MGLSKPNQTKCCHGYWITQIKRTLFTLKYKGSGCLCGPSQELWVEMNIQICCLLLLGNANQTAKMKVEGWQSTLGMTFLGCFLKSSPGSSDWLIYHCLFCIMASDFIDLQLFFNIMCFISLCSQCTEPQAHK